MNKATQALLALIFNGRSYLKKINPQWFSHLKDCLTQEGLNLNEQFAQTYLTAHELVKAFQALDYRAFIADLSRVENVSSQLMINIKTSIHNKQLIKNMTAGQLSNGKQ